MSNRIRYVPLIAGRSGDAPRNARLGNTWSDRRWRHFICVSLGGLPRPSHFPSIVPSDATTGDATTGPEPRTGWTPKTDLGGVWAQPVRHFS